MESIEVPRKGRFNTVDRGPVVFNSVLVQVDDQSGRATAIQRIDSEIA